MTLSLSNGVAALLLYTRDNKLLKSSDIRLFDIMLCVRLVHLCLWVIKIRISPLVTWKKPFLG